MFKLFNRLQWKLTLSHFLVSSVIVGLMMITIAWIFSEESEDNFTDNFELAVLRSIQYDAEGQVDLESVLEKSEIVPFCRQYTNWRQTRFNLRGDNASLQSCLDKNRIISLPTTVSSHIYDDFVSISVWTASEEMVVALPGSDLTSQTEFPILFKWLNSELLAEPVENQFHYSAQFGGHLENAVNNVNSFGVPILNATKDKALGIVIVQYRPEQPDVLDLWPMSLTLFGIALVAGLVVSYLMAYGIKRRLVDLQNVAAHWAKGNFSAKIVDHSMDEIGQLSGDLNQMADQLDELVETRSLLAGAETRNRLARDLHDAAKQQLFAAGLQLDVVSALMEADPEKARSHLGNATELTKQAQTELAAVINELRPIQLQEKGLFEASREAVKRFSRQQGIAAEFNAEGKKAVSAEVELGFYRILQEALSNVAKHSRASQVKVMLNGLNEKLSLTVADNGVGFNPEEANSGFGLHSMRQRIERLGGRFNVESSAKMGTNLRFELKLDTPISEQYLGSS